MDKTIYEIANDYIDKNVELKLKIIDLQSEIKELKRIINLMKFHNSCALNIGATTNIVEEAEVKNNG